MYEVVNCTIAAMVDELVDEFFGAYIEYDLIGMKSFYLITNSLRQVRLTQTYPSINDQWIERSGPWLFGHGFTCTAGNTVAIAFNKKIKSVSVVQLGIDLHFFETGDHKRIFYRIIYNKRK